MADSKTGVPVFTIAELADAADPVNDLGVVVDNDAVGTLPRQRWDSVATVAVVDAPGDLGDGNARVHYVSKTLGSPWLRIGSKLGITDPTWIIVPS